MKVGKIIHDTPKAIIDAQNHILTSHEDEEWEDIGEEEDFLEVALPPKPAEPLPVPVVEEVKSEHTANKDESFTLEDLETMKSIHKEKPEAVN